MPTILVYDRKNYFFRFIKNIFTSHNVIKANKISKLDKDLIANTSYIFMVNYDDESIFHFMYFYRFNKNIIICSDSENVLSKYKDLDEIICFDISKPKNEIVCNIKNLLET